MRAVRPWAGRGPTGPLARLREPLHGVRKWRPIPGPAGELLLGSLAMQESWLPAGMTTWARCDNRRGEAHPPAVPAPAGGCGCGLYAVHPALAATADDGRAVTPVVGCLEVVGIVAAWGTVHVHREGFRAQYARPTALLLVDTDRDSDVGRLVTDLAIGHRSRVVELDSPAAIGPWCRENGLGLSPERIEELVAVSDAAPPKPS